MNIRDRVLYTRYGHYATKEAVMGANYADAIRLESSGRQLMAVHPVPTDWLREHLSGDERTDVIDHINETLAMSTRANPGFIEALKMSQQNLKLIREEESRTPDAELGTSRDLNSDVNSLVDQFSNLATVSSQAMQPPTPQTTSSHSRANSRSHRRTQSRPVPRNLNPVVEDLVSKIEPGQSRSRNGTNETLLRTASTLGSSIRSSSLGAGPLSNYSSNYATAPSDNSLRTITPHGQYFASNNYSDIANWAEGIEAERLPSSISTIQTSSYAPSTQTSFYTAPEADMRTSSLHEPPAAYQSVQSRDPAVSQSTQRLTRPTSRPPTHTVNGASAFNDGMATLELYLDDIGMALTSCNGVVDPLTGGACEIAQARDYLVQLRRECQVSPNSLSYARGMVEAAQRKVEHSLSNAAVRATAALEEDRANRAHQEDPRAEQSRDRERQEASDHLLAEQMQRDIHTSDEQPLQPPTAASSTTHTRIDSRPRRQQSVAVLMRRAYSWGRSDEHEDITRR